MEMNQVLKLLSHASTFFAPIIGPIIIWLLASDRYVKNVALQALVFHISMSVLIGISWALSFILIGIPFLIVFGIMALYCPIKGIFYSLTGRTYYYPIIGRLING
ncbi:DUF4870 domain-containing protein [Brevibacterium sp. JNUCC-42]|nr:DUF4870 domain-containing protein [Brevibacterium sp. JNUCC-42]